MKNNWRKIGGKGLSQVPFRIVGSLPTIELALFVCEQLRGCGGEHRARISEQAGDLLETHCAELMGLMSVEAGRSIADTLSEVREAVDYCSMCSAGNKQPP